MARIQIRAPLVNGSLYDYEVSAAQLVAQLVGEDFRPPAEAVELIIETDNGYRVTVRVAVPRRTYGSGYVAPEVLNARVDPTPQTVEPTPQID